MKKVEIEDFPELVKSGKLSQKEAINLIAEEVQKNPIIFGVTTKDDELRSEILLRFIQNGYFIFDHYKKDITSFKNYISSFLKYQKLTIERELFNVGISDKTYSQVACILYENTQDKYLIDEAPNKITNLSPYYFSRTEKVPYRRTVSQRKKKKNFSTNEESSIFNYFRQSHSSEGKLTLILALKSSFFLSENQIRNISHFCRIPLEDLSKTIAEIRESMLKNYTELEKVKERRDYEYFMHRKYQELIKVNEFSKEKDSLRNKYDSHTKKWKLRNKKLELKAKKVCPTNKKLATMLGICERQVGYYLNKATSINKIFEKK